MINYSELNLKVKNDNKKLVINNNTINIKQYLPIIDKNDIITLALQQANEDGIYNPLMADMAKNVYIIFYYTDLIFTKEEKSEPYNIYDELKTNGILDKILSEIPEEEIQLLDYMFNKYWEEKTRGNLSIVNTLKDVISAVPEDAEFLTSMVDNFDPNKYQEVVNFAKAVGKE